MKTDEFVKYEQIIHEYIKKVNKLKKHLSTLTTSNNKFRTNIMMQLYIIPNSTRVGEYALDRLNIGLAERRKVDRRRRKCFGSGSSRVHIIFGPLDQDQHF